MKVNIRFESKDPEGEMIVTNTFAVMEIRERNYKLVFVEDLSGEGDTTKSTILMSPTDMRLIRKGAINSDFMYGKNMEHNTTYETPYGTMPVTLTTKAYEFEVKGNIDNTLQLEKSFLISLHVAYDLALGGEALPMDMKLFVTSWDENIKL